MTTVTEISENASPKRLHSANKNPIGAAFQGHTNGASHQPSAGKTSPLYVGREQIAQALEEERSQVGRWRFSSLTDAFAPRPPIEWLVDSIFSAGSLCILYGAPGTLKTMLAIDVLLAVASGQAWLRPMPHSGGKARQTTKAPVMLVDFDSGMRRTSERIEALARARNLDANSDAQVHYVSMPTPWLTANERDSVGQLVDEIRKRGVRLVLLDNLGTISGGIDENSSEMVQVMGNLRWLAESTGACVIVIHHERKSNGDAKKGGEALRGHSSINAALDLALLVEREDNSRMISVRSTKTRDTDVAPFGAEWNYEHKDGTSELGTAWFWGVESESSNDDRAIEQAILASCDTPKNKTQIKEAMKPKLHGVGENRIDKLIASLDARKQLVLTNGAYGAKVYQRA